MICDRVLQMILFVFKVNTDCFTDKVRLQIQIQSPFDYYEIDAVRVYGYI